MVEKNRVRAKQKLRKQAEERLKNEPPDSKRPGRGDIQVISHELEVHQIELEMQNDELQRIQLDLHQSRDKYLNLYEYAPVGYFTLDKDSRILEVNLTGAVMLSKPRGRLLKTKFSRLIHPESQDTFYFHLQKVLEKSQLQTCELQIKKLDGTLINVLVSSIARADDDGQLTHCFSTISDVTLETQSKELIESEQKYRNMVETADEGILIVSLEGQLTFANQRMADLLGYSPEEMIGRSGLDFMEADQKDRVLRERQGLKVGNTWRREFKFRHKDGSAIWTLASASPYFDGEGHLIGSLVMHTDITQRRQAEEKNLFLSSIVESSDDAIIGKTPEGIITSWNQAAEKIYGYTQAEIIGKSILTLVPLNRVKEMQQLLKRIKQGERIQHYETVRLKKDGTEFPASVTISPILNNEGDVIGVSTSSRDITEREQAEEALRQSEYQLKRSQEIAHLGSWELDLIKNRLSWSDEVYRIFGLQPQEFGATYEAFLEAILPDDRAAVDTAYSSSLKEGRDTYEIEHRVIRKLNREIRYVHEKCQHVRDEKGKIIRSLGMVQDITERKQAEEKLKESEKKYHDLFINMTEGFALCEIITDANDKPVDYCILELNQAWEKMTGLSASQVIGKPIRNVVPDLEQSWVDDYGKVALTGEPVRIENYNKFTDRWYEIYAYSPRKGYFVTLVQNISERKHLEKVLLEKQTKLQIALDSGKIGIHEWNILTNELTWDNRVYDLWGLPQGTPVTLDTFIGAIHTDDLAETQAAMEKALNPNGNGQYDAEFRIIGPGNGIQRWLAATGYITFIDNKPVRLIGATWDISERKQAELVLKESEERFLKFFRSNPAASVISNMADGTIVDVNESFEHLFGYSRQELIGHRSTDFNIFVDPPRAELMSLVSKQGNIHDKEVTFRTKNSKYINTLTSIEAIQVKDQELILSNVIDITERKHAEQSLEKANKELETFSYSVSHDLRAPLRTINGFSEAVLTDYGDKLDETGKDYLQQVRRASQNMAQLIEDILKLSRISRAEMYQEEVNLTSLVQSILEEFKSTQPGRLAEFIVAPQISVKGDKNLLKIGLRNLLDNAWKYTGKCETTKIEFGLTQQNGIKIYFIKDNGAGFDMRYAEKLFQPFQRLHSSKDYPGTGIGLATVQRVIHRHGGRIWAESEIGKGTTFYFALNN